MQKVPFLFIIFIIFLLYFILFYSTTNKMRCIQRLERKKFKINKKKTVNPNKPSAFLWVIGTQ